MAKVPSVVIATPAYGNMVHVNYLHTIFSLQQRRDIRITLLTIGNESLITRARNNLLSMYYHHFQDWDYLLFLDADIGVDASGIVTMANRRLDMCCAPYRLKNPAVVQLAVTKVIDDSTFPLVEVEHAATGVMMLSRKLVEDVVSYAKKNNLYYPDPMQYTENNVDTNVRRDIYDVFQVGIDKDINTYLSEDYWFCRLVRQLGYNVYVDMSVATVHSGTLALPYNISMAVRPTAQEDESNEDTTESK